MPVFRVTYDIVAPDKASAEKHAKFVDKPNAYFKVCKVMGPRPRHKWTIEYNGRVLDTVKGSKKHCLNYMNYLKKSSNPTVNKRVYKVIQIPGT
jgi:hypothetical protein